MSKRSREEDTPSAVGAPSSLPPPPPPLNYFDPSSVPTRYNTDLKLLIAQLQERFVHDLARIEEGLEDIISSGATDGGAGDATTADGDGTGATDGSSLRTSLGKGNFKGTLPPIETGLTMNSSLLLAASGVTTAAAAAASATTAAGADGDEDDDDGLMLTADMLFGGDDEEGTVGDCGDATSSSSAGNMAGRRRASRSGGCSLPSLEALVAQIQQGLRSRSKAMVLVDMVLQLQQERAEMLRMKAHMQQSLGVVDSMLREGAAAAAAEGNQ